MELQLTIKNGSDNLPIALSASSTVLQLKQQLEQHTGIFVRNQKLIYKGKVLEDSASLEFCRVSNGAKLMLLATEGLPVKGQPPAARNAAQQCAAALSPAAKGKPNTAVATGNSLLAEKMANMAAAREAAGRSFTAAALNINERRAAWVKTGVIALRDMQLAEIQDDWLQGTGALEPHIMLAGAVSLQIPANTESAVV
eukprot:GHUV01017063.1.p1 GENE.GHUV01017063.1~~GHUV01017063.1.p1  ORF type:complete len:198 (+),score=77.38 GHUV01017063.1:352-945(+)